MGNTLAHSENRDRWLVVFLTTVVAIAWGLVFMAMDVLLDYMDPIPILAVRWTLAAVAMLIILPFHLFKVQVTKKNVVYLCLVGFIQGVIYPLSEIFGLDYTSSSLVAIFESLVPCMSLILGAMFFKKKLTLFGAMSIVVVFAGVMICTVFAPGFSSGGKIIGYILLLVGAIATALYSQMTAKVGDTVNPMSIVMVMAFVAAICHTVTNLVMGYGIEGYIIAVTNLKALGCFLFVSIGSSIMCFAAYAKAMALAKNPALAANVNGGLVTVVGVVAGVFIRNNVAGWYTVVGVIVILIGVAFSTKQV